MSTRRVWKVYGDLDPYFGVLANDSFRANNITASAKEEFYRSGERELADHLRLVESVAPLRSRRVAVDFGCGVGRLSFPLAARYEQVYGVDISPGMLSHLKRNASERGVSNIECLLRVEDIPQQADLIVSRIVLQHIPVVEGLRTIPSLFNKLAQGGVLAVEVLVRSEFGALMKVARWTRDRLPFTSAAINAAKGRPLWQGGMQMNVYPLNEVVCSLYDVGVTKVSLLRTRPDHMHDGAIIVAVRD